MSLVLGSVILFILISPGLLFRFGYLQGTYAKLSFKVSAAEEVFWALIPALIFQLSGIILVESLFAVNVRLDIFYNLINGAAPGEYTLLRQNFIPFLTYIVLLLVFSIMAGIVCRKVIQAARLDLHWKFLRFGNEWYYLLSGEILNLPEKASLRSYFKALRQSKVRIQLIQVDALVNTSEGDVLYCGSLNDYYLSKDNGLDRIYLTNVYRRIFNNDLQSDQPNPGYLMREMDERYYTMPGARFVIPFDKIINLNVTYYTDEFFDAEASTEEGEEE
jgi:hypothetical protein